MDPSDYFSEGEKALCSATAFMGSDVWEKGTLVCTQKRLLFHDDGDVVDIDSNRIDAIELSGREYPEKYQYGALVSGFGAILWVFTDMNDFVVDLPEFLKIAGVGLIVAGILILLAGLLYRTSTLKVHTGASSFEFNSKDPGIRSFPGKLR